MFENCDNDYIRSAINGFILIAVVLIEMILLFMPDKCHYSYQGDVISKESVTNNDIRYIYIETETNDTMSIVQCDDFYSGYYTKRTNERQVYTYRWYLSSIVWAFPAFMCLLIFFIYYLG